MTIPSWEHRYDAHPLVRAIRLERAINSWLDIAPRERTRDRWHDMMRRALTELGPRPTP